MAGHAPPWLPLLAQPRSNTQRKWPKLHCPLVPTQTIDNLQFKLSSERNWNGLHMYNPTNEGLLIYLLILHTACGKLERETQ